MQTVLLVRHGYPLIWDQQPTRSTPPHQRIDPPLAEIGQRQATHAARRIADGGALDALISSPFRGCLETADAIASATDAAVTADWRLGNVLLSTVLGVPFSPTSGMDPAWAERRAEAGKPAHPESDRTLAARVAAVIAELKARKPFAQRIAVVSHDIILTALYHGMTGRAGAVDWHPGAITVLQRAKLMDRQWRLVGALADAAHLGADDRTEPQAQVEHRYHPRDSRS